MGRQVPLTTRHPAKFTDTILDEVEDLWARFDCRGPILDPFAGTGKIHGLGERLGVETFGVEIEPEWARAHRRTIVGDALALPFPDGLFGAVVTSPTYGNRMADHHEARDSSRRNTYRHALGRPLTDGSSAGLQWGDEYRRFHERAWAEVARVLDVGGSFFLNVKDHVRRGEIVEVSEWHRETVEALGFVLVTRSLVAVSGNRQGENGHVRVPYENVFVFEKVGA